MPGSLSPTIIWFEGDESLHVPRAHGNFMQKISQFVPSKPSDRIQLEKILSLCRHPFLENDVAFPVAYLFHDSKEESVHDIFFRWIIKTFPLIKSKGMVN